ncbi:hypothetical protein ACFP9V_22865 [Deinococcus radiopugnans]|uniref:hypothetical protein n=1 Tax=Deinococcus radiopugnans TaxID=57497 RepID=UPI00361D80CA
MNRLPASRKRRGPSLGVTLLLGMLAVVGLSVGSTFVFSNLAVRNEVRRLPPRSSSLCAPSKKRSAGTGPP